VVMLVESICPRVCWDNCQATAPLLAPLQGEVQRRPPRGGSLGKALWGSPVLSTLPAVAAAFTPWSLLPPAVAS